MLTVDDEQLRWQWLTTAMMATSSDSNCISFAICISLVFLAYCALAFYIRRRCDAAFSLVVRHLLVDAMSFERHQSKATAFPTRDAPHFYWPMDVLFSLKNFTLRARRDRRWFQFMTGQTEAHPVGIRTLDGLTDTHIHVFVVVFDGNFTHL